MERKRVMQGHSSIRTHFNLSRDPVENHRGRPSHRQIMGVVLNTRSRDRILSLMLQSSDTTS